jgi:hypothetical protein
MSCHAGANLPLLASPCATHGPAKARGLFASAVEFSVRPRSASAPCSYDLVTSRYRLKALITGASHRFAQESPLEEDGLEPAVPPARRTTLLEPPLPI